MPDRDPPEKLHLPTNTHCKTAGHKLLDEHGYPTEHLAWFKDHGMPFCDTCHNDYMKKKDDAARPKDENGKPYTHCEKGHRLHHKNIIHIGAGAAGIVSFCGECAGVVGGDQEEPVKKGRTVKTRTGSATFSENLGGISDRADEKGAWNGPLRPGFLSAGQHSDCVRCGHPAGDYPGSGFKNSSDAEMTLEHVVPLARGGRNTESGVMWSHRKHNVDAKDVPITADEYARWYKNNTGQEISPGKLSLFRNVSNRASKQSRIVNSPVDHSEAWNNFHSLHHSWEKLDDKGLSTAMFEDLHPRAKIAYNHWVETQSSKVPKGSRAEYQKWHNWRNYRMGSFTPEFDEETHKLTNVKSKKTDKYHGGLTTWFGHLQSRLAATGVKDRQERTIVSKEGRIHPAWKGRWNEMMAEPLKIHEPSGSIVPHRHLATILQAGHEHQLARWERVRDAYKEKPIVSQGTHAKILSQLADEKNDRLERPRGTKVNVKTKIGFRTR